LPLPEHPRTTIRLGDTPRIRLGGFSISARTALGRALGKRFHTGKSRARF
jgi:hypothetical protein